MQAELKIIESIKKKKTEDGDMPPPEAEPFHWTDIFYHKRAFEFMGIENPGGDIFDLHTLQYYIWLVLFYLILFIPIYIAVRTLLFLILPRTWLRWMFRRT